MNGYHIDDELLTKYLLGEADAGEQEAVQQWINLSVSNKKYFDHVQLIWETSKKLDIPSTINTDDAWMRFRHRTLDSSKHQAPVKSMTGSIRLRAAVIVVLAVCTALLTYFLMDRLSNESRRVTAQLNPVIDTLPDGSVVTLNKNSSITYPERFKQRNLELQGEAFFNVTPDRNRPFVIHVNDITVTVVGTSFNVKNTGGKTQVLVETGTVRVTRNQTTVELHAKEKLVADPGKQMLEKDTVTDQLHQYYRSKEFVCDNTPLWKLVEVLNEAYNVNIVIARAELRTLPLTSTFYNESLDKILSVIAETFDISIEKRGEKIIIQ